MASAPVKAKLQTASEVRWSDGTPFQGSLLMVLAFPRQANYSYTESYLKGVDIQRFRIPTRVKVPIVDGVMDSSVRLWKNADIEPPKTLWVGYWYDESGKRIAVESPDLVEITTDPTTITPPTLTVPTATSDQPPEFELHFEGTPNLSLAPELFSGLMLYNEIAAGSGSTVTISQAPTALVGVWVDGVRQVPTTAYTFAGTTVTFVSLTPPAGQVRVLYLA